MDLVGVADTATDWRIKSAANRLPVFASTIEAQQAMRGADVPAQGVLDDLLAQCDVVVDTTPKHVAAGNLERYRALGVKAVLQGGESHSTTGHSFVAQANYASAIGRDSTRVVSCNTTSIVRILGATSSMRAGGVWSGLFIARSLSTPVGREEISPSGRRSARLPRW
jgi:glyceraldehyde-3-phosphate dehydrogenase (NAD(P))